MASIQLSSLVTDITGSIGGTTFSRNRSGLTAKAKLTGKRSTTARQQIQLQNNNELRQQWAVLTVTEKQVWNEYALVNTKVNRYGRTKTLTGFNWFLSVNNAYYYVHGIYITVPPAFAYPAFLPTFSLAVTPTDIILTWSTPIDDSLIDVMIYTTPPVRGTANLQRGFYRATFKGVQPYAVSINLTAGWQVAHGMTWANISNDSNIIINVMVFAVAKSSGITGTAVSGIGVFATTGVGSSIIESTFTVG